MLGAEVGIALGQRVEHVVVVKIVGKLVEAAVARDGIEIEHGLVHAAKLIAQHQAARILVAADELVVSPAAHRGRHLQRLLVARVEILVDESAEELVERVPGRPYAAAAQIAVDKLLGECAQIARRTQRALHLGKPVDQAVALELEYVGARGGVHQ